MNFFHDLRPASFRGVPFYVEAASAEFGRRIARHEYPESDEPYHEDVGAKTKSFTLDAVVIGPSYKAMADQLEAALVQKGPGTLIHPRHGELEVVVTDSRSNESLSAVGEVVFNITFEKYGPPQFPSAASNSSALLGMSGDSLFGSLLGDFTSRFGISGSPDYIVSDALTRVQGFSGTLRGLFNQGGVGGFLSEIFPQTWSLTNGNFGQTVIDLFQNIVGTINPRPRPVIGPYVAPVVTTAEKKVIVTSLVKSAEMSVADVSVQDTATQAKRVRNARCIDLLFRIGALCAAAKMSRHVDFESKQEAKTMRDSISTELLRLRDIAGAEEWDDTYMSMSDLLAALTTDINSRVGRLPNVVYIQTQNVRTSLDLSNRLYGDTPKEIFSRADDLAARNSVRHPGFFPASQLEVIAE